MERAELESAQAAEDLSWTAWWLDDAEGVFAARERAYRLYRRGGDAAGAARMATWLAVDELDFRGAVAVAGGWIGRARRLLASVDEGPDHGWLAFHEGYLARLNGEPGRAAVLAGDAARAGRRFAVADLEMLGLALEGALLVDEARVEEGMRCLDEAAATALGGDAAFPMSTAWTFCFLVSACATVLDFARAGEWCDRIAEFAERHASRYMLGFCRAEYGAVHLWRGHWIDAERVLGQAVADFESSRPAMVGGPLVALAELRRRQGRAGDAEALLDRAGASPPASVCRARLALDRGDAGAAVAILERVRRQQHGPDGAAAVEALALALLAAGDVESAAAEVAVLRDLAERVRTSALRACASRVEGMLAGARGDVLTARDRLEDAVDGFEAGGARYEAAVTRAELAAALTGAAAASEARAALRELEDLGAAVDARRARALLDGRADPLPQLTAREREVLGLLAAGLTNRAIAGRLVISEHTVHRHVGNLLRKLGLSSRTAAAAEAVRSGLVPMR